METQEHSVETLAYTAGLIDGEGCICIAISRPNGRNGRISPSYYLHIRVANTSRGVLEWLKSTFSGSLTSHSHKPSVESNHRPVWIWTLQSHAAQQLLQAIHPYLKIKQQQASVAIEFQNYHDIYSHYGETQRQDILLRKEEYRKHIQFLNARSRVPGEISEQKLHAPFPVEVLAYLAAFFDGEGSVKINVRRPGARRDDTHVVVWPSHSLLVHVTNTDWPVLEWLQSLFSGYIPIGQVRPGRKVIWNWRLVSDAAQHFLELLLPYLKIKREHAILAIEFQTYHRTHSCTFAANCTQEVLAQKEGYRQRINKLALQGKPAKGIEEWLHPPSHRFNPLSYTQSTLWA